MDAVVAHGDAAPLVLAVFGGGVDDEVPHPERAVGHSLDAAGDDVSAFPGLVAHDEGVGRVLVGAVESSADVAHLGDGPVVDQQMLFAREAQAGGRRYYKAYLADKLAGEWRPLADSTKRQRGSARPILVRTGKLMRGFKTTKFSAEEGVIENAEKPVFVFPVVPDRNLNLLFFGQYSPWQKYIL